MQRAILSTATGKFYNQRRGRMIGLKKMLLEEEERLEKIIRQCKGELEKAPEGSVRISIDKNRKRFYYFSEEKKQGIYLSKKDQILINQLIQKAYHKRILRYSIKKLKQLKKFTHDYEDNAIELILQNEHEERQKRIVPVEKTWNSLIQEWMDQKYIGKLFSGTIVEIYTEKGERVRSKSEKILADFFYHRSISYKYECPVNLKYYGVVYPDFTFLSPKTGKEIYWEHFGMMDDSQYASHAINKIDNYARSGIFIGDQLIVTFETKNSTLNMKMVENYVKESLER